MSRFFRTLLVLTLAMHAFFGVAVYAALVHLHVAAPAAWAALAAALGILLFWNRARLVMPDRKRSALGVRFLDVPFYIHFCAAFFTLLPSLAALVVAPLVSLATAGHIAFPVDFVLATYVVGLTLAAYGTLVRRRWFVIERVEVPIAGLPRELDGYRIVQLSDLHVGSLTPRSWAERWVKAANDADPDLAVVTGDMVTSGVDFHDDIAETLSDLRAKDGAIVSMGNHDYFGEGDPLITKLRAHGLTVMRNEGRVITKNGASFYLAAVDDTWTRRADLPRALRERPADMPVVLLAHEPNVFDAAAEEGIALQLSGHTHGGQVAVPFFARTLTLSKLGNRYHWGVYRRAKSVLYVHPGLGTTGPPIRLGVPPAVTVITLRAAR